MGKVNTHCRYGARGSTRSTRWAAVSSARRAVHDGQRPRRLHAACTKGHQQLVAAGAAADAGEAASEQAAADHAVEFTLDDARHDVAASTSSGDEAAAVQPDSAVQGAALDVAGPVVGRQRGAGFGPALVPVLA